jgi:hypothetical protein
MKAPSDDEVVNRKRAANKAYYNRNKHKAREYYLEHRDRIIDRICKHQKATWDEVVIRRKLWREKNPDYYINRLKNDAVYRVTMRIRGRLSACMKSQGFKKVAKTQELIGCTWVHLKQHLEDNDRGLKMLDKDVHVDHIRPMASFKDLHCEFEQRTATHFFNLQILPAKENLAKHAKFDFDSWAVSDSGVKLLALNREWRMQRYFAEGDY